MTKYDTHYHLPRNDPPAAESFDFLCDDEEMDWQAFDTLSDEEVNAAALTDPDCPPLTPEQLERFRPVPHVKSIRERLGMSQEAFCEAFGFALLEVKQWEAHTSFPSRHARLFLQHIQDSHTPQGAFLDVNDWTV